MKKKLNSLLVAIAVLILAGAIISGCDRSSSGSSGSGSQVFSLYAGTCIESLFECTGDIFDSQPVSCTVDEESCSIKYIYSNGSYYIYNSSTGKYAYYNTAGEMCFESPWQVSNSYPYSETYTDKDGNTYTVTGNWEEGNYQCDEHDDSGDCVKGSATYTYTMTVNCPGGGDPDTKTYTENYTWDDTQDQGDYDDYNYDDYDYFQCDINIYEQDCYGD